MTTKNTSNLVFVLQVEGSSKEDLLNKLKEVAQDIYDSGSLEDCFSMMTDQGTNCLGDVVEGKLGEVFKFDDEINHA